MPGVGTKPDRFDSSSQWPTVSPGCSMRTLDSSVVHYNMNFLKCHSLKPFHFFFVFSGDGESLWSQGSHLWCDDVTSPRWPNDTLLLHSSSWIPGSVSPLKHPGHLRALWGHWCFCLQLNPSCSQPQPWVTTVYLSSLVLPSLPQRSQAWLLGRVR